MEEATGAGNRPAHSFQVAGTSRVCAEGCSTQPSAVSSRKNTEKGAAPLTASHFHSNKLAARLSVRASLASRHRIHPDDWGAIYPAGVAPGFAPRMVAP